MLEVVILEQTYNVAKHSSAKALEYILKQEFEDLQVEVVNVTFDKNRYAVITLDGEDEVIAKNILINNFGTIKSIGELELGEKIYGRLKEVGGVKFGLFVDAGIQSSTKQIDALFPLYELREQLAGGKKASLMNIVRAYGFVDNIPFLFEVVKKQVLGSKVWVKLSPEAVEWLKEPIEENKDSLIICGSTRNMIKTALTQTNHEEDIEEIERIGLLEYRLVCKRGTRAEGLIPELGPFLGRSKIGAIKPVRINEL